MARKLFCEINPLCYEISVKKEIFVRNMKDLFCGYRIAKDFSKELLPIIIKGHSSILMRKLYGVDEKLQKNKITNIKLACDKINGIIIHPGEVFSFWKTVGKPCKENGYKEGLFIGKNGFKKGYGGGMCQMANMIHYLILNSPLEVVEIHHHSDALFPDDRRIVPFGTGTSILYNNVDYRFRNNSDQDYQLVVWIEDGELCGELRCMKDITYRYKLIEENHHFKKEKDGKYYRISQVYRLIIDKKTGKEVKKELVLKNHSEVMYDYKLIPKDQIRNDD